MHACYNALKRVLVALVICTAAAWAQSTCPSLSQFIAPGSSASITCANPNPPAPLTVACNLTSSASVNVLVTVAASSGLIPSLPYSINSTSYSVDYTGITDVTLACGILPQFGTCTAFIVPPVSYSPGVLAWCAFF